MSGALAGRVALVTGGSRGIGAAIARALAGAEATTAITYRADAAAAQAVAADLGPQASIWRSDAADAAACRALIDDVVARHGRLDALVLNAATWRGGRIEELPPEDWQTVVDTSLGGPFHLLRAAIPVLREGGWGRVVLVSSVVGLIGWPGDGAYAAAKAGQLGLMRSLAKELGRDGITVNAVAPGFVETDMTAEVPEAGRERMVRRTALRRPGQPEEIASAVRFLVADGGYVTGHTLVVDGGLTL